MNTLTSERVSQLLEKLHQDAKAADGELMEEVVASMEASGGTIDQLAVQMITDERTDYRAVYKGHAEHFLSVSPNYGRFL